MIHSASRAALAQLEDQLEEVIGSEADLQSVAGELHAVSRVLAGQPRLRRALADPSTAEAARANLAAGVLGGKVSSPAVALVQRVVRYRWSNPWDMTDALSIAGDTLLLGSADKAGHLDDVEDQLFRFGRIVRGDDRLRTLLDDQSVAADRRSALLVDVLGGKTDPVTTALLDQGVRSGRKRTVESAIDELLELTATRRGRSIADVASAVPLSDRQLDRLAMALTRLYGRTITVRVQVDPAVRGGLVIRVGNEVIDGSVAQRLATVRAELAG